MPELSPMVYVVDNDVSVRKSLQELIRTAGWQPALFASAEDFLSYPSKVRPSCLVLEVMLPGLNGLALQQQLTGARADIPVIFITAQSDVPMSVRAMKAGATEFLAKPFNELAEAAMAEKGLPEDDRHIRRDFLNRFQNMRRRV